MIAPTLAERQAQIFVVSNQGAEDVVAVVKAEFAGLESDEMVDHVAVWLNTLISKDPFSEPELSSIDTSLDFSILMPRKESSLFVDIELDGRLKIGSHFTNSAQRTDAVQATFTGRALVIEKVGGFANGQPRIVELKSRFSQQRSVHKQA